MGTVAVGAEEVGAVSTACDSLVIGLATGADSGLRRDSGHVHKVGKHVVSRKVLDTPSPQVSGELALRALNGFPFAHQTLETLEAEDVQAAQDPRVAQPLTALGARVLRGTRLLQTAQLLLLKSLAAAVLILEHLLVFSHLAESQKQNSRLTQMLLHFLLLFVGACPIPWQTSILDLVNLNLKQRKHLIVDIQFSVVM